MTITAPAQLTSLSVEINGRKIEIALDDLKLSVNREWQNLQAALDKINAQIAENELRRAPLLRQAAHAASLARATDAFFNQLDIADFDRGEVLAHHADRLAAEAVEARDRETLRNLNASNVELQRQRGAAEDVIEAARHRLDDLRRVQAKEWLTEEVRKLKSRRVLTDRNRPGEEIHELADGTTIVRRVEPSLP